MGRETEANECSFTNASKELIPDHGVLCVCYGVRAWSDCPRQEADVQKTVIRANRGHSQGHVAAVDSQGGCSILHNSTLAKKIRQIAQT